MRTWGREGKRARGRPGTRREREEGALSHRPHAPPRPAAPLHVPGCPRREPGPIATTTRRARVRGVRGLQDWGLRNQDPWDKGLWGAGPRGGIQGAGSADGQGRGPLRGYRALTGLPAQGGQDRSSPGGCAEGGRGPSAIAPPPAGPPPRPPSAAALALRRSRKVCTDPDPAAPRRRAVTGARPERARRTAGRRAKPPAAPRGEHLGRGPEGTFGSRASGGRDCGAGAAGLGGAGRRDRGGLRGLGWCGPRSRRTAPFPTPARTPPGLAPSGRSRGLSPSPVLWSRGRGWGRGCRWLPGALRRPHSPLWAPGPPPWERTKRRGRAPEARGLTSSRSPRRAPAPRTARWHRRGPGWGEGCLRPTWPLLCRGPHWRL